MPAVCLLSIVNNGQEVSVMQALVGNHLLLAGIILLLLLIVPALLMRGHKLRDPARRDRRKLPRQSADRRA
jgi:hypothetical protein